MKEITEKLNNISKEIISERKEGRLRLFALIARTDLDNKWDILISADWIKKNNSEEELVYIIKKLKKEFSENLDFLSRLVLLTPKELFTREIAKATIKENDGKPGELFKLKTSTDFIVKHIIVIHLDYKMEELTEEAEDREPVVIKDKENF
jgi:hypothetical protein